MNDLNPIAPVPSSLNHASSPSARRRRWPRVVGVVAVGIAIAAGVVALRQRAAVAPPAAAALPSALELSASEVATARPVDLRRVVRLAGVIQAVEQVQIRAQVAASVAEVLVRDGDRVAEGQVLARLDTRDLEATLAQRLANLTAAEAQLSYAAQDLSNKQRLAQSAAGSRMAAEQAKSSFEQARTSHAASEALVAIARKALTDATIRAPIGGTIDKRAIDPGGVVAVGTEMFRVLDLATLEVAGAVSAADIGQVRPGQMVEIRLGAEPPPLSGTVTRVNPATEAGSQVVLVHVSLPADAGALRAGMFVSGQVVTARAQAVLAVPQSALRGDDGAAPNVLKVTGDKLVRQPVEIGLGSETQGLVEIRAGLADGDVVIAAPLPGVAEGQTVRLPGAAR